MPIDEQFHIPDPDDQNEPQDPNIENQNTPDPDATIFEPINRVKSIDERFPDPFQQEDTFEEETDDNESIETGDEINDYFSNDPLLKLFRQPLVIVGVCIVFAILLLLTLLISRTGAVIGFLSIIIISTGVGRLLFRIKRVWLRIAAQALITFFCILIDFIICYPLFAYSRDAYAKSFLGLNEFLAGRISDNGTLEQAQNIIIAMSEWFKVTFSLGTSQILLLSLQLLAYLIIINMIYPLVQAAATVQSDDQDSFINRIGGLCLNILFKIGQFSFLRLLKAFTLTIICIIGLKIGGFDGVFFIATFVFFFTMISTLGPLVAICFALPLLADVSSVMYSIICLAVTFLLLTLFEAKLNLILKYMPGIKALKLPEETFMDKDYAGGVILRWMPRIVSIILFIALLGCTWIFYESYSKNRAYTDTTYPIKQLYKEKKYDRALAEYLKLIDQYPNHRINCLRLIECYIKMDNYKDALDQAEVYASWEEDIAFKDQLQVKSLDFLTGASMNPLTGYRIILKNCHEADVLADLANQLKEANAGEAEIAFAQAKTYYYKQNYHDCLQMTTLGLGHDPSYREFYRLQAMSYFEQSKYQEALQSCDKYIKINPVVVDEEMTNFRTMVVDTIKANKNPQPEEPAELK